jgi:hypothetical protein
MLLNVLNWLLVMTVGLSLLLSGLYMSVGKWWHEREDAATLRYHKMCDPSSCGYANEG